MSDSGDFESGSSCKSKCIMLRDDDAGGEIEVVEFERDEHGDLNAGAAHIMGLDGERVRCFSVPHVERELGYAVHLYIDLQGIEHKLPHNTNATQFWLAANLPQEPPEVAPSSIHGPVLVSAENVPTEEYRDLTEVDWKKIMDYCKQQCPSAVFVSGTA